MSHATQTAVPRSDRYTLTSVIAVWLMNATMFVNIFILPA